MHIQTQRHSKNQAFKRSILHTVFANCARTNRCMRSWRHSRGLCGGAPGSLVAQRPPVRVRHIGVNGVSNTNVPYPRTSRYTSKHLQDVPHIKELPRSPHTLTLHPKAPAVPWHCRGKQHSDRSQRPSPRVHRYITASAVSAVPTTAHDRGPRRQRCRTPQRSCEQRPLPGRRCCRRHSAPQPS